MTARAARVVPGHQSPSPAVGGIRTSWRRLCRLFGRFGPPHLGAAHWCVDRVFFRSGLPTDPLSCSGLIPVDPGNESVGETQLGHHAELVAAMELELDDMTRPACSMPLRTRFGCPASGPGSNTTRTTPIGSTRSSRTASRSETRVPCRSLAAPTTRIFKVRDGFHDPCRDRYCPERIRACGGHHEIGRPW